MLGPGRCSGSAWTDGVCNFLETLTDNEMKNSIRDLCSDMWKPYLNVLA